MRTKSMEQLKAQWLRISDYCRERGYWWEACKIMARYFNRMYEYVNPEDTIVYSINGICDYEKANRPVPRDVYTKQ